MDEFLKTTEKKEVEEEFSFKKFFTPLTTLKAIHWIVVIGLVVFANMLFNGFVWDDITYITMNPEIHTFHLIHLFGVNEFNSSGYYRPIPALYFSLLYTFFGTQSFFYHLFQLMLHIINACLLFYFFKKFFKIGYSFFLTLLFLIHPIQVESVAYIGASQSELFFLFGIIALLVSMKKVIAWKDFVIISIFLLLSLLTKETGILFIFIIFLLQFLFTRKRTLSFLPSVIATIGIYFFIRFILAKVFLEKNTFIPLGHFSLMERLINVPEVIYYYIKTIFYPARLSIDQLWAIRVIDFHHFYYPLFIDGVFFSLIGFFGYYVYQSHKRLFKVYILFLVWFVIGLSMLLQLYPLDMTVAERWFYFPIVGLLGLLGITLELFTSTNPTFKKIGYTIAVCVLLFFSFRSMVRNANWANAITLYSHDAQISDNFDIENTLGTQLAFAHQYKEALPHIEIAVKEYPHDTNLYDLGYVYEQLGDYQNAKKYYERVLAQKGSLMGREEVLKNTYDGLARVLTLHDKPEIAKIFLAKALAKYPQNPSYWAYLALCQYSLKEQRSALASAQKARAYLSNVTTEQLYNKILHREAINVKER